MTRAARARIGCVVGCLLFLCGLYLLAGAAWALVAAGVLVAAYSLLLMDVDKPGGVSGEPPAAGARR